EQSATLMNYRLAYLGDTMVNWCAALGTVLANDEVSEGLSVRGGHPVEQKLMRQWCLRVSAYAERLLNSLDSLEWTEALKETQRNWIGRSEGAEVKFPISGSEELVTVFTTRPDTIYGVSFMVLAPESELVSLLTTEAQRASVDEYLQATKRKTERERIADRRVSGVFSGSYAINPITGKEIPIWISDYVLAGYGTGAIMAVPAHDSRDFAFARHFDLPIVQVVIPEGEEEGNPSEWDESKDSKAGTMVNSDLLNGLSVKEAQAKIKALITERGLGRVKVNYRLRDAIFSRQRYWGEPFPVYYKDGIAEVLPLEQLPLCLPEVDKFLPTETGEPPLGRAEGWYTAEGYPYELSTMPGFAGSSAYYLRYMDPRNEQALVGKEANEYWRHVDLYIGGTEHATGHLIYSRFWNKFLFDLGTVCEDEPFRRLVNQGMIQGRSNFVYRIKNTNTFVSFGLKDQYDVQPIHVDVNIVSNDKLDLEAFKAWQPDFHNAEFILEDGQYVCGWAIEKMSKSMHNVVNPDTIIERYGADTLRFYEMFLGPLEQSKPWDTNGIDGVHRFLKKLWNLYWAGDSVKVTDEAASKDELKSLHKLIKKVTADIENFSFNTSVSAFMICVNELTSLATNKREILKPLLILLSPYAPHIAEELWHAIGEEGSVVTAEWPELNEAYLVEDNFTYPVSFNGKTRFMLSLPATLTPQEVEAAVLSAPEAEKWLEGKTPRKVIVVPKRIVNIVL
ncbi:MAG: leucine--tRNA ligase, partial [Porphyromonas sp.]|nr:leucine--tRNA ligase [Porphyromonas sp.]